jgi:HK97 family phage prohead protease
LQTGIFYWSDQMPEYKAISMRVKKIDGRKVKGLASIFGNIDEAGDIVEHGAFSKTIKEQGQRIKHLWQHDMWMPPTANIIELVEVGANELPDEVRQKYPDATGGLMVTREYLDTERGNEVLKGLDAGAITEMSFAFDVIKKEEEELEVDDLRLNIRRLKELRLWETSDVLWGMNSATVAAKAAGVTDRLQAHNLKGMTNFINSLKAGGEYRPEDFEQITSSICELQEALKAEPDAQHLLTLEKIRAQHEHMVRKTNY